MGEDFRNRRRPRSRRAKPRRRASAWQRRRVLPSFASFFRGSVRRYHGPSIVGGFMLQARSPRELSSALAPAAQPSPGQLPARADQGIRRGGLRGIRGLVPQHRRHLSPSWSGYYNRNQKQTLDIPVGPNKPDRAWLDPIRTSPRTSSRAANGACSRSRSPRTSARRSSPGRSSRTARRRVIRCSLDPLWIVDPLKDAGDGNTPPTVRFQPTGAALQGPAQRDGRYVQRDASPNRSRSPCGWPTTACAPRRRAGPRPACQRRRGASFAGPAAVTFASRRRRSTKRTAEKPRPPRRSRAPASTSCARRRTMLGRRRRRLSVLLDQRPREGHRQVAATVAWSCSRSSALPARARLAPSRSPAPAPCTGSAAAAGPDRFPPCTGCPSSRSRCCAANTTRPG